MGSSSAGLDVDKMDYLCRDQIYTNMKPPWGGFCTGADVEGLLLQARVATDTRISGCRTEIAFLLHDDLDNLQETPEQHPAAFNMPNGSAVHLLEGLFRARAAMHELCYQCGCGPAVMHGYASLSRGTRDHDQLVSAHRNMSFREMLGPVQCLTDTCMHTPERISRRLPAFLLVGVRYKV